MRSTVSCKLLTFRSDGVGCVFGDFGERNEADGVGDDRHALRAWGHYWAWSGAHARDVALMPVPPPPAQVMPRTALASFLSRTLL